MAFTPRIGSLEMARSVAAIGYRDTHLVKVDSFYYRNEGYALGSGFYLIGAGISRAAILAPDNVIYKAEARTGWSRSQNNRAEFYRFKEIERELPFGWRIPNVALYSVDGIDILAAEYVRVPTYGDAQCNCRPDEMPWQIEDNNEGNFAHDHFAPAAWQWIILDAGI